MQNTVLSKLDPPTRQTRRDILIRSLDSKGTRSKCSEKPKSTESKINHGTSGESEEDTVLFTIYKQSESWIDRYETANWGLERKHYGVPTIDELP